MNWRKHFCFIAKQSKCRISVFQKGQSSALSTEKNLFATLQDRGYVPAVSHQQAGCSTKHFQDKYGKNISWGVKLPCGLSRNMFTQRKYAMLISCQYSDRTKNDADLSRDFFVQLWVEDKKRKSSEAQDRQKVLSRRFGNRTNFKHPSGTPLSGASVTYEGYDAEMNTVLRQPPTSQSLTGALKPSSAEEVYISYMKYFYETIPS